MRLRHLPLAALLLAACNSILDNPDRYLVAAVGGSGGGPSLCRLDTECPQGNVCLFQTCGPPCNGDRDCVQGARCLKTETGTACVDSSAATCDAGCPEGTICSSIDGKCRNECETNECLTGQTCRAGVCISAPANEMGSGGSGGDGGTSGAAGVENAGAGAGGADPASCDGVVCNTPRESGCTSTEEYRTYDRLGSCTAGECDYAEHLISCTCHDGACTTSPCTSVKCETSPVANCADADTLTTYPSKGVCNSAGNCEYTPTDTTCKFGCAKGACKPDPCESKICNTPPSNTCKSVTTKTTHSATGMCSKGDCSYTSTDTACDSNQQCGGAGVCALCKTDGSCGASCTACAGTDLKCKDQGTTSKCVACLSDSDCGGSRPACNTTTNVCEQPSCIGLAKTCGPNGNLDCCDSSVVTGGTFYRGNDSAYFPATVSSFRLDTFEITVGRFRKFLAAYAKTMTASGAGKNPNNASDPGWDTAWNASLPADATALKAALKCGGTWADTSGTVTAESLPMSCINWFEAESFCIWDGGRLPTEAEWNYSAAGGAAQRMYPWGSSAPDCSYANFYNNAVYCAGAGQGAANRVGAQSPKGDGLYGQSDLAGNVYEWTQDWYASPYPAVCNDCANFTPSSSRVLRGGGFSQNALALPSSYRFSYSPTLHVHYVGARCARML